MKKTIIYCVLCLVSIKLMAQDGVEEFALTKIGAIVDYSISAQTGLSSKGKLVAYARLTVADVSVNDDKKTIIYNYDGLTPKKKPMGKNASDIKQKLVIENGLMIFEDDPLINAGTYKTSHEGFAFKIPVTMKIGDKIETGTITERAKFPMHKEIENIIRYDDFCVVGEEDINTNMGMFHCYKVSGKLNGTLQTIPLEMTNYAIWFSPKIGIVKIETDYYKETLLLDSVTGF